MTTPDPERVRLDLGEDGVAEVVLTRPARMNALDPAMFDALSDAIETLRHTPGLRAVVLHGEGRAFCAGLDLTSVAGTASGGAELGMQTLEARTHGLANRYQHVAWGWRELAVPVIAALHGVAFGGGLQIALGADIRIAAPDTRLSVMEIRWGLVPDMAGCALLASLVRADRLRELVYTGRIVEGEEAAALGLVTRIAADPLEAARALARQVASQSPDAERAAKRLLNLAEHGERAAAILVAEAREQQALIGSPNQAEAVRAGTEKRTARWVDPPVAAER